MLNQRGDRKSVLWYTLGAQHVLPKPFPLPLHLVCPFIWWPQSACLLALSHFCHPVLPPKSMRSTWTVAFVLSDFSTLYCLPIDIHKAKSLYFFMSLLRYLLSEPTLTILFKISAAPANPHPLCLAFWISLSCSTFFVHSTYNLYIYNLHFLLCLFFIFVLALEYKLYEGRDLCSFCTPLHHKRFIHYNLFVKLNE